MINILRHVYHSHYNNVGRKDGRAGDLIWQIQQYYSTHLVFLLIKTAQNSFGLKNGDYTRYRNYCAHKVHKLRHNLGIKFGTKFKFIKKDLAKEYAHDSKILQIFLFNA